MREPKQKATVGARIVQRLNNFADALKSGKPITERFTCRKIQLDLKPTLYDPSMVKKARKLLNASQPLFARFLGVSVRTVRSWEQGINTPSDMACRFMDEIQRDPPYWIERLMSAVVEK